jgi:hypothetical protein
MKSEIFDVTLKGTHAIPSPFKFAKKFVERGHKRVKIVASFEGSSISFHGALQKRKDNFYLTFGKKNQKALGVFPNDYFQLQFFEDTSKYGVELPEELEAVYALSLGLIFSVGAEVRRLYEDLGIELERYQGNDSYFLPIAAKFIVGRDGLVKARQVNVEFRRRMEPAAIVAALKGLREQR